MSDFSKVQATFWPKKIGEAETLLVLLFGFHPGI